MKIRQSIDMTKLSVAATISCVMLLTAQTGMAKGYCGYVHSGSGELARDSDGHCIRAGSWEPKYAIEECDPEYVKKAAPKPKPKPAPVVKAPPKPKPAPVMQTIELKAGALFDTNSAKIKSGAYGELDALASELRGNPNFESFKVVGHTDSRGKASYNLSLSRKRANAVRDYLVGKGVDGNRISAVGMGETQPIADNNTAGGRAQNRRVEIQVQVTRTQ